MKKHKRKVKHWYMHTMEEQPAQFYGGQIIYRYGHRSIVVLVETLTKIQQEQQRSREFRAKRGWDICAYDYVKVAVPEQDV